MKLLHRQIINNLAVGLIPILLIISIVYYSNKRQAEKNARKQLSSLVSNFKSTLESDLSKYRDYAYFIGAESKDYILNGRFTTSEYPVNIESFDFRLYEVFYYNRLLYHDTYSWSDNIYYSSPVRSDFIWKFLSNQKYSIFFKMSFPETVSNTLILRNCAILTKKDFDRIGFVSVVAPLDSAYLSKMNFVNQNVILFIQTASNITFSDPGFGSPEIVQDLLSNKLGSSSEYKLKNFKKTGRYYYYKETLYSSRSRISNRFVVNNIADVGILYNHKTLNKEFFLFRKIIFIILLISLLVFPVIAYFSGKKISSPILRLKKQVDRFKDNFSVVPQPRAVTDEISMLHQSFCEMSETVISKSDDLTTALTELALAHEALGELTIQDGLTGIKNRLFFNQKIESEIKRAGRLNETLSLLMIDIDFFKKVNDTFGHEAGDQCLKQVATILTTHANRTGDAVSRYGGEEFSIILPNTDIKGAKVIAERMRQEVEANPVNHKGNIINLTISIGIAGFTAKTDPEYLQNIVSHADEALYKAKDTGRNKVVIYKKKRKPAKKKS